MTAIPSPAVAGRPARRWCHATTGLDDFAIISWAVDPERVAALLPAGFVPDVRGDRTLVSAVPFLDVGFRFRFAPYPRLSCGQVNYRAYVHRGNETGVWFFGTSLDSPLVLVPQRLWRMPWHRDRIALTATWEGDRCVSWRLDVTGGWGAAAIELRGTGRPLPLAADYADQPEASRLLLDPTNGWFRRRGDGGVGRYTVWHEPLALEAAEVVDARCQVFTDLGLIAEDEPPAFAGLQRRVQFDVHTPPTRQTDRVSPPTRGRGRHRVRPDR
ncbi:MAG: hypothetical protein JWN46_1784 [Acidimicrobiales bacterium]|nr:hypothetical protein [Acidimicrobiales bacterium]